MTLPVTFTREAERDIEDAFDWYEKRVEGLGSAFIGAVESALANIENNPRGYQVIYRSARRAGMRRFPYGLYYVIRNADVVIVACHHAKRDPAIWRTRI
ncbi:MAG: type II toxin-antitoxin system RelE/ParE family toxin [Proteobacteria bacterium]|nr:type II toxin-antitoxin system RelE/ParE family toxin [Pseudomonadota bacterium]